MKCIVYRLIVFLNNIAEYILSTKNSHSEHHGENTQKSQAKRMNSHVKHEIEKTLS